MDEFRQNNRLRGALDAALSGLSGDPALAQRVLRCDLLHGGVLLSPLLRDVPLYEYLLRPSLGRGVL